MPRFLNGFFSRIAGSRLTPPFAHETSGRRGVARFFLTIACACATGTFLLPASAQYDLPRDTPQGTPGAPPGTPPPPAGTPGAPPATPGAPLEDARRVTVGVSASHDSNFFRDPAVLREAQSETITTGYAGLLIDKSYSQQRFFLGATATAYRYNNFSYLDFEGFDYRAAWYWKLGSRLGGTISADRTQTPTQFQDTLTRQSNVTTAKSYGLSVDGWLFAGWHLLLGISQLNRTSEQATLLGQPDYDETRSEAGLRYLFQSGSTIDALWRRIDGEQESQVINNVIVVSTENYEEDQSELRASWILSPTSTVIGRATYLDRRYELTPESDFSGTGGELGYYWSPTVKLRVRLAAARNIVPWKSLTSNYRVSNTFTFAPIWQVTEKTNVYLSYVRTDDEYPAASAAVAERKDTTDIAVLGLTWLPARLISIGASVHYEQRSSNNPLVEYDTTIARISASIIF